MASGSGLGGSPVNGILPLAAHLDLVADTSLAHMRLDPRTRVKHKSEFDAMKGHIASLYQDVEAVHSFEDAGGTVFDCIPVEQQPSLRGQNRAPADPPDLTPVLRGGEAQMRRLVQEDAPATARRDRHGNAARGRRSWATSSRCCTPRRRSPKASSPRPSAGCGTGRRSPPLSAALARRLADKLALSRKSRRNPALARECDIRASMFRYL